MRVNSVQCYSYAKNVVKNQNLNNKIYYTEPTVETEEKPVNFKGAGMGVLGAIGGALAGFIAGGPIGALAGVVIGAGAGSQADDTGEFDDFERDSRTRYDS